jgi:hypothetical protein
MIFARFRRFEMVALPFCQLHRLLPHSSDDFRLKESVVQNVNF